MKTNRKVTTRRNSDKFPKGKDRNPKTMPEPSAAEHEQTEQIRNQLAAIVELSDDAIIGKTLDGIIISWNEGARKIYGYGAEEVVGRSISILIPPGLKDELPSILKRVGMGERIDHYETVRLRKDGQRIEVSLTISPIRDSTENIIGASTIARDITDRKQAVEALKKSENDYRYLFDHANDVIIVLEPEQEIILEANAMACKTYGFSHNELVGMSLKKLTKDVARGESHIKDFLDRRPQNNFESVHLDKNGREIHFLINCSLIEYMGKKAILSINRDITKRKQAEEALHASETRYRLLVEASPDAVTQTDMDGKILMCNMQAAILHGYEHPDELIGQSVFGFFPPDELERATANMRKTLEDGIIRNVEYRLVKKDGSQFPAELSAALIRDAAGKPVTFMALTHDITKRKQAEKVVAEERNLLLTLINNLPDRIYVKDIQSRKTISNTADWQTLGVKRMEDVIGKTDFDTYPAELAAQYWADDKMVLDSGKPVINREEPNLDWQDNLTWTLTTKVPLRDDNGQVVGLVGIGRDFTERRQVEERLRENETMYRLLFDSAPVGILLVDTQGKILEVNPAALQILGSPSAEATKEINLLTFQPLIEAGISADFQKGMR